MAEVTTGTTGAKTQIPAEPATVSALASASGGIAPGNLVEPDIDDLLFQCQSEDTALMSLMLKAKKVPVDSPIVQHYMIDEQRSTLTTSTEVTEGSDNTFKLPLVAKDKNIVRKYQTLLVCGVDGYDADGATKTAGKDLMLFVTDKTASEITVIAVNGKKTNKADQYCTTPGIPAGSKIKVLANALYETQKEVDPDLIMPQPSEIILQKRGMNQVVSDYFESQKKRIPFTKALIAQAAILNFKRAGNRTLWAGRGGRFVTSVPGLGEQMIYTTEGIRWQFKRELHHSGKWSIENLIALAKMYYTGEDVPKDCILLAGKNLLEELQCIDYSKHPEIQISQKTVDSVGWSVLAIHTVFGDIQIKREPTLDTLGWSNSGALISADRLVHYTRTTEHSFEDRVVGQEATRSGVIVWDALALKGTCHIWIDGEGNDANSGSVVIKMWDKATAPTSTDVADNDVLYLMVDCPAINTDAQNGQMWQAHVNGSAVTFTEYTGAVNA